MARIAGVDLPREKRIEAGLTYIYGVGPTRAQEILRETGVDPATRVRDLPDPEVRRLREFVSDRYLTEGDLRREVSQNIRRKVENGSYAGIRHRRGLPVRGQRTHTNARSRKGSRRSVGGAKKDRR